MRKYTNLSNVTIPKSVNTIGDYAFKNLPVSGTVTLKGRTNTDGMTLGTNWNGQAQIVFP